MNKNKSGFSLAELLLCFAIIGVVSAMGMTLTKHNVEKAYRSYWQAGYNNLLDVIYETDMSVQADQVDNLIDKCAEIFNGTDTNANGYVRNANITAKNGISYVITRAQNGTDIHIVMTVPQPKTRRNPAGTASTELAYMPDTFGLLIPIDSTHMIDNTRVDLNSNLNSNLLRFYNDNGQRGQRRIDGTRVDNNQLVPQTFQDAFCASTSTSGVNISSYNNVNCPAAPNSHNVVGIIRPVPIR